MAMLPGSISVPLVAGVAITPSPAWSGGEAAAAPAGGVQPTERAGGVVDEGGRRRDEGRGGKRAGGGTAVGDGVAGSGGPRSEERLTDDERRELEKLRKRDRRVRAHEQAHVAAAGALFRGGPFYEYQTGPDGKRYAVGGSVSIDTAEVPGDPEATIRKAAQIVRAALAPMDPSTTDRSVAAKAKRMEAEARQELIGEMSSGAGDGDAAVSSGGIGDGMGGGSGPRDGGGDDGAGVGSGVRARWSGAGGGGMGSTVLDPSDGPRTSFGRSLLDALGGVSVARVELASDDGTTRPTDDLAMTAMRIDLYA